MSRVGRAPISLPPGVEVKIEGGEVTIKGSKGELHHSLPSGISVSLEAGNLIVSRLTDAKFFCALHGLSRSIIANMVKGVTIGFVKNLELKGVGFRVHKAGDALTLEVGYTHPVKIAPPPGISFVVEGTTQIKVAGIDKELVGRVAAEIRAVHPPDSYKGKGIKYLDEKLRIKPGKAGKVGGKAT